ncbi:GntR family transcriptional regulator [Streptomyces sp. NPDC021098]|uniref:GntR family transcriptional regulator n=1 Tax=unclassified Streptomyces TaxID=2593676 RepID=UPI00379D7D45
MTWQDAFPAPSSPRPGEGDADVLGPDVPIQVQLYRQLRAEILDGLWVGRTGFPGERDLAERYGVSLITSRRALERLAREGLVVRGRGRRATSPYVPPEPPGSGPVWFVLDSEGSPDAFRPLRVGVETAPADACRAFGLAPGSTLWQCVQSHERAGKPLLVSHHVQHPEVGARHTLEDLRTRQMLQILSGRYEITAVRRSLRAGNPSPLVRRHLGIAPDTPVLTAVIRVHGGPSGGLLEWVRLTAHPDLPLPDDALDLTTGRWAQSGTSGGRP